MAKLTKIQLKNHQEAVDLLNKDKLNNNDRWFILEHWRPSAADVTQRDAFFTPHEVAMAIAQDSMDYGRVLDLCGGIGMLAFHLYYRNVTAGWAEPERKMDITVVENNPAFVEVGKKLLPFCTWIEGSIFDEKLMKSLGKFDQVVSNPPFGSHTKIKWLKTNGDSAIMAIEVALHLTRQSVFILPQNHTPWKYNNNPRYEEKEPSMYARRFMRQYPAVTWRPSNFTGFDEQFVDTSIPIEIAHIDTPEYLQPEQMRLL